MSSKMSDVKPVITILSDSPFLPTGYSNQAKLFCRYLEEKGYTIHYLANAFNGATIENAKLEDGTEFNFKIYGEMQPSYFANTMSQHLKETKSDVFWILLDTFMLFQTNFMNQDTSPARTFFWYPSDGGGGMPKGCENILKKVEGPVSMAEFGQKQVKDYYGIDTHHIPHGTEPDKFFKLPDDKRAELKAKWGFQDKYVVGVVARNQPRKNLDRTIKAFKILADMNEKAILFLHLDPTDPANPMFSIPSLIEKYQLQNRVVFSGMKAHKGFGWDQMNDVYNLMDVFFLSTSGEGFGIPIIEAMSCEIPVIATDYTTTPELVFMNNAGLGIKLSGVEQIDMANTNSQEYDKLAFNGTMTGSWEVERGFCDIYDAANKLQWIHEHPNEAKEMGKNGRKAVLEKYDFMKVVAPQWEKLILESLGLTQQEKTETHIERQSVNGRSEDSVYKTEKPSTPAEG